MLKKMVRLENHGTTKKIETREVEVARLYTWRTELQHGSHAFECLILYNSSSNRLNEFQSGYMIWLFCAIVYLHVCACAAAKRGQDWHGLMEWNDCWSGMPQTQKELEKLQWLRSFRPQTVMKSQKQQSNAAEADPNASDRLRQAPIHGAARRAWISVLFFLDDIHCISQPQSTRTKT